MIYAQNLKLRSKKHMNAIGRYSLNMFSVVVPVVVQRMFMKLGIAGGDTSLIRLFWLDPLQGQHGLARMKRK